MDASPTDAIRTFCRAECTSKEIKTHHADSMRAANDHQKAARAHMRTMLETNGATCVRAADGKYIRLVKTKYMRAMAEGIIHGALLNVPVATLRDPDTANVVNAIYAALCDERSSVRDKVVVSPHCAKDEVAAQGRLLGGGADARSALDDYTLATDALKRVRATIRDEIEPQKLLADSVAGRVEQYMRTADLDSQHITLTSSTGTGPSSFYLRRRTTTSRPALSSAETKAMIMLAVQVNRDMRRGGATGDDSAADSPLRSALAVDLWTRIRDRPTRTTTRVALETAARQDDGSVASSGSPRSP